MKSLLSFSLFALLTFAVSCTPEAPTTIQVGSDQCDYCKMTITEAKYATQLQTEKGRLYKFDDIKCLKGYRSSNEEQTQNATEYYADFPSGEFVEASTTTLISGGTIKSPMGGNTQAYIDANKAQQAAQELKAELIE